MRLVTALLLVLMVAPAGADTMGLFFDESDFDEDSSRLATSVGQPFSAYVVLLDATPSTLGGYELGITYSSSTVTTLSVSGPNGWTNFGSSDNHLVGYVTPLPTSASGTVLGSLNLLQFDSDWVTIDFGPSSPASISGSPVIADGASPDDLTACELFGGGPTVADLNRPPQQYRERRLGRVKALFE